MTRQFKIPSRTKITRLYLALAAVASTINHDTKDEVGRPSLNLNGRVVESRLLFGERNSCPFIKFSRGINDPRRGSKCYGHEVKGELVFLAKGEEAGLLKSAALAFVSVQLDVRTTERAFALVLETVGGPEPS